MNERNFYGPLHIADGAREGAPYDNSIFEHPEDPESRIVRPVSPNMYSSETEMYDQLRASDVLRADAMSHGIQIVPFEYTQDAAGEVLQVVEKIPNAVGVSTLFESRDMTDDQVYEINVALENMASYFTHVARDMEGNLFSEEMLRMDQAVYSPDLTPGQRVVIVDVEPFAIELVYPGEAEVYDGFASHLTRATAILVRDACRLAELSGESLRAKDQIAQLIDSFGTQEEGSRRMVEVLRTALADEQISEGLNRLADAEHIDGLDEE